MCSCGNSVFLLHCSGIVRVLNMKTNSIIVESYIQCNIVSPYVPLLKNLGKGLYESETRSTNYEEGLCCNTCLNAVEGSSSCPSILG
mmetsp:Transcript_7280/g.15677  ORF Transcript_7280/g.15677 Transcript_7280/m.15677 type:complete len:87 (-) Transcript_7280:392-652(-)